jgi:hypothetical protein
VLGWDPFRLGVAIASRSFRRQSLTTLLEQQKAALHLAGMLATVLALLALSVAVDLVSSAVRRSLR